MCHAAVPVLLRNSTFLTLAVLRYLHMLVRIITVSV